VSPIRCHRQSSRRRGDEERGSRPWPPARRPTCTRGGRGLPTSAGSSRRVRSTMTPWTGFAEGRRVAREWPGPHAVRSLAELEDVEAAWGHRRGRGLGDAHTRSVSSPGDRRLAAAGLVQLYLRSETLENPWRHVARGSGCKRRPGICSAPQHLLGQRDENRHVTTMMVAHLRRIAPEIGRRAERARQLDARGRWSRAADHQDRAIGRGYASLVGRDDRPVRHRAKPDPPVPGRGGHDRRDRRGRRPISAPATMSDTWWRSRSTRPSAMASASA
jgi:hypothetical protein